MICCLQEVGFFFYVTCMSFKVARFIFNQPALNIVLFALYFLPPFPVLWGFLNIYMCYVCQLCLSTHALISQDTAVKSFSQEQKQTH